MSDSKKYYYIKLKDNFFNRAEIKILEKQPNGLIYSNLYLKLCLLSLKGEGRLMFMDDLPYDEKMLSDATGLELDNVRAGMVILQKFKLITRVESGEIWMNDIHSLIGHSSTEGERKANYRKRIGLRDNVPILSDKRPPELELKTEINTGASPIKDPNFNNKHISDRYIAIYQAKHNGEKPTVAWGGLANALIPVKETTTEADVLEAMNYYFKDTWLKDRNAFSPYDFFKRIDVFKAQIRKPRKSYTTVAELEKDEAAKLAHKPSETIADQEKNNAR